MKKIVYLTLMVLMADFGCNAGGEAKRPRLPRYEVSLGKGLDRLVGRKWPTYSDGRLFETALIQEPCELLLHLPSAREFTFEARNADIDQEHSVVNRVTVRMPLEPVDYQEAITLLDGQYARLTQTRDPKFAKAVEDWKSKTPTPSWPETHMTRVQLEERVELELGVQTVNYKGADKWIFFLTLYQSE